MNLRVLIWRVCAVAAAGSVLLGQVVYNNVPSQIVGQAILQQTSQTAVAANLVEGRELSAPQGLAVDLSATPPILYVADTANNRVLAWKNVNSFQNGAFADLVLGQHDKYSVLPKGPGTDLTAGFNAPTSLAVDTSGNLYVADTVDNRIMRFPQPFNQTSAESLPDLVIGQKDLSSSSPNQGNTTPSASTICFTQSGVFLAGMAFDQKGNLYVSDPCNNRVLRFPQKTLQAGGFNPSADLVLGQSAFTTNSGPPSGSNQTGKNFLLQPSGIALDNEGRLYVADSASRVLVFDVPVSSGQNALRIMGVVTEQGAAPVSADTLTNPDDVVVVGDNPYVVDSGNHRILGYPPFSQWPAESSSFSPSATVLIGQTAYTSNSPNHGAVHPDAASLSTPVAAAWSGAALLVADTKNNRVLSFPQASAGVIATSATGVLGQTDFPYNAPNLIEGREFYFFSQNVNGAENSAGGGYGVPFPGGSLVIDTNASPPHMYVSDPGNNRILGFRDYRKVAPGVKADIVIGQTDFSSNLINSPATTTEQKNGGTIGVPNATGLWFPQGLALDASGDLYVADEGNGRVLRFPVPFAQTGGFTADLVIGQRDFVTSISDPSPVTMGAPYGVAISASGDLLVSDIEFNRILLFTRPGGGDFTNGQTAAAVIGQTNYTSVVAGTPATNGLSGPRLMSVDALDNLYVADTGNNRIAIYSNASSLSTNATPSLSLGNLHNPLGVSVSSVTGDVWVVDTQASVVLEYPPYSQLIVNPTPTPEVAAFEPLSVTFDPFGNPVVADSTNRVGLYYPIMDMKNTATNFLLYAPGMLATLTPYGTSPPIAGFGSATVSAPANAFPVPTTLGDVQVLVNGVAAPLLFVSSTQISFQIPMATPTGGLMPVQVVQASTGQIYTSDLFNIVAASPGLFEADATTGALAAINATDNTVNSSSNPVKAGDYITLFGTGQGFIAGAPPDGTAPSGPVPTAQLPTVFINGPSTLSPGDIEYSGLAPGYIGLWQINARVPSNAPPGPVNVFVTMDGFNSLNDPITGNRIRTIIYVKAAQ